MLHFSQCLPLKTVAAIVLFVSFLRATAATAVAHLSHRSSVCSFVRLSVCHTGGSVQNGAS